MPDAFDPYYQWLGIPQREQPVNYYRLLALNLYETNLKVIANAADRQMTYIRMFQSGDHAKESQTILNEIAKARVTLLNETDKREYDNNLKRQAFRGELRSPAPPVPDAPSVFSFKIFEPASDAPPASPDSGSAPVPVAPSVSPANGSAPVRVAPLVSPANGSAPVPVAPPVSPANGSAPVPVAPPVSPANGSAPVRVAPSVSPANGSAPVRVAPSVSPVNGFTPVLPETAWASNSTAQKTGAVSEAERLRRKTGNPRIGTEEKAKQNLILTAGAIGSCFLVLLAILVLINKFFLSSSTAPSSRERELADTSQITSQTIEEPSDVAGARIVKTVNGVEFAFRWCPPGTFTMGSPETEEGREPSWGGKETPHSVTLTKGFWLQETEVTQAQWKAVMGNNPSEFKGDDLPVEKVSWDDCQEFCRKCEDLGLAVQLPTEAQWEYACRAGSTTRFSFGDSDDLMCTSCNYCDKSNTSDFSWQDKDRDDGYDKTAPVKSFQPNAWGLYDMHGNVWEGCNDWYEYEIASSSVTDPKGPEIGVGRVGRGGGWDLNARYCRSAYRSGLEPGIRSSNLGFRLSLGQQPL